MFVLTSLAIEYVLPELKQTILGKTSNSNKSLFSKNGISHKSDDAADAIIQILPTLTPSQLDRVTSAIEQLNEQHKEMKDHSP